MEIDVNNNTRMVSVWLTNAEKGNNSVQQELMKLCARNRERKYKTAVFLSGDRDLADCTQSLLQHNRYRKPCEFER